MRRKKGSGLVPNEEIVLLAVAAMRTETGEACHGYALSAFVSTRSGTKRAMSYTTIYRCLTYLEDRRLLSGDWETESRGGPPRRVFTLSTDGLRLVHELEAAGVHADALQWGTL